MSVNPLIPTVGPDQEEEEDPLMGGKRPIAPQASAAPVQAQPTLDTILSSQQRAPQQPPPTQTVAPPAGLPPEGTAPKPAIERNASGGFKMAAFAPLISAAVGGVIGKASGKGFSAGASAGLQFGTGLAQGHRERVVSDQQLDEKRKLRMLEEKKVGVLEGDLFQKRRVFAQGRIDTFLSQFSAAIDDDDAVSAMKIHKRMVAYAGRTNGEGLTSVDADMLKQLSSEEIVARIKDSNLRENWTDLRSSIDVKQKDYPSAIAQKELAKTLGDPKYAGLMDEATLAKLEAANNVSDRLIGEYETGQDQITFDKHFETISAMKGDTAQNYLNNAKKTTGPNKLEASQYEMLQDIVDQNVSRDDYEFAHGVLSSLKAAKSQDPSELKDAFTMLFTAQGQKPEVVKQYSNMLANATVAGNHDEAVMAMMKLIPPIMYKGEEFTAHARAVELVDSMGIARTKSVKSLFDVNFPLKEVGQFDEEKWTSLGSTLDAIKAPSDDEDSQREGTEALEDAQMLIILSRGLPEGSGIPIPQATIDAFKKKAKEYGFEHSIDPVAPKPDVPLTPPVPAGETVPDRMKREAAERLADPDRPKTAPELISGAASRAVDAVDDFYDPNRKPKGWARGPKQAPQGPLPGPPIARPEEQAPRQTSSFDVPDTGPEPKSLELIPDPSQPIALPEGRGSEADTSEVHSEMWRPILDQGETTEDLPEAFKEADITPQEISESKPTVLKALARDVAKWKSGKTWVSSKDQNALIDEFRAEGMSTEGARKALRAYMAAIETMKAKAREAGIPLERALRSFGQANMIRSGFEKSDPAEVLHKRRGF